MSKIREEEYIEISLSKILIALYENKKTFIGVIALGFILTLAFAFTAKSGYEYEQMIKPPLYLDGQNEVGLFSEDQLRVILNNILSDRKQLNEKDIILNNVDLRSPTTISEKDDKNQKIFFSLSVKTGFDNKSKVIDVYNNLMVEFSNSNMVKKQVELWKKNIERNVEYNNDNIVRYTKLMNTNETYLKGLELNKGLAGLDGQALLSSYTGRIDSFQQKMFSLEDSNTSLNLRLDSLQSQLSNFGDITYNKVFKNLKANILIAGAIFSILLSLFVVFIKVIIRDTKLEYKKSENSL